MSKTLYTYQKSHTSHNRSSQEGRRTTAFSLLAKKRKYKHRMCVE